MCFLVSGSKVYVLIMHIPFTSISLFSDTLDLYTCFSLWSAHTKGYMYIYVYYGMLKS